MPHLARIEWPTVALFFVTYAVWGLAAFWLADAALWLAVPIAGLAIAFHASLQHEAIHGHPTPRRLTNTLLASAPLTLFVPYLRFRDTHLAHHQDAELTDPYDDPESHFMMPEDWKALPRLARLVLSANNTLAGRLILGPVLGTLCFMRSDLRSLRSDKRIVAGWAWHGVSLFPLLLLIGYSPMPLWAYLIAAYLGLSLLRIRTFLEHRAHEKSRARSVIIEDDGLLAFLFLNNNLHAVHHAHPKVPWYDLPALYHANSERFLEMNGGYRYASYCDIAKRYLFRRKDPVPHPLRR